jgi:hypothetical protein
MSFALGEGPLAVGVMFEIMMSVGTAGLVVGFGGHRDGIAVVDGGGGGLVGHVLWRANRRSCTSQERPIHTTRGKTSERESRGDTYEQLNRRYALKVVQIELTNEASDVGMSVVNEDWECEQRSVRVSEGREGGRPNGRGQRTGRSEAGLEIDRNIVKVRRMRQR